MPPTVAASSFAAVASNDVRASGGNFGFVVVARSCFDRRRADYYFVALVVVGAAVVEAAAADSAPGSCSDLAAVEIGAAELAAAAVAEQSQPLSSAAVAIAALDLEVVATPAYKSH